MVFNVFHINFLFESLKYLLILKMFTEILPRIPFSVIGRTFSSANLSLAAGKMRQNKFVTGGFL
jgi:hypothetical protein